jgi:Leucine-rich repeat (LRR) protein
MFNFYMFLKAFPKELFEMKKLEAIKLRSNPIKYLPDRLGSMVNLKILNISYCLLTELPASLYDLHNLCHLDVSYNRLGKIDEDVTRLSKLKTLIYDGNEIEYLPACMLKMKHLERVSVRNNYLHPLIWQKYLQNEIQVIEKREIYLCVTISG